MIWLPFKELTVLRHKVVSALECRVTIASAPPKLVRIAVCRVNDLPTHPYCFGIVRLDSSTWSVTAGTYLGFMSQLSIFQCPEDFEFFT